MNQGVYVVIGAGPGNGLATAERVAQEGFSVALLARSAEKLEGYQASSKAQGRVVGMFPVDAGDAAELGALTVLHGNAVGVHVGRAPAVTPENLDADLKVGVVGAPVAVQPVLSDLGTRGGTLVFTCARGER